MAKKEYLSPKLESCPVFEDTMKACTHNFIGVGCYTTIIKSATGGCGHLQNVVVEVTCIQYLS